MSVMCSSEPAVPGDDEVTAASPEPEVEKEAEAAAAVELKPEALLETQADTADDPTHKSPTAAPPTAEPVSVSTEPAPAAPEENRVSGDGG